MKSGKPLEVRGALQSGYRVVDYLLEDSDRRLVVLKAYDSPHTFGGKTIITYYLDETSRNFVAEKEIFLSELYLQIEVDTVKGGLLAVPFHSRKVHLLDINFQVGLYLKNIQLR